MAKKNVKRRAIPKKIRFEVLKRDKFKCVYCGATAPDVLLHIDHVDPVANNGTSDILNLVTACSDCNLGKGARKLDDNSVVAKKRNQLEELQERQEQIQMMIKWQNSLKDIKNTILNDLKNYWEELAPGFEINEHGIKRLKGWIREFSYEEIREAMDIAADQYLIFEDQGTVTSESWNEGYAKMGGIARNRKDDRENPGKKELMYICGILRNRIRYNYQHELALTLLKRAHDNGTSTDELKTLALKVDYWDDFEDQIEAHI